MTDCCVFLVLPAVVTVSEFDPSDGFFLTGLGREVVFGRDRTLKALLTLLFPVTARSAVELSNRFVLDGRYSFSQLGNPRNY